MQKENFYAMEGLDAVGKSTVRDLLKEKGYFVLKTPPDSFAAPRESYDGMEVLPRFLFYLMGVMKAAEEVNLIQPGQIAVCDRYVLTTIAAHEAMGLPDLYIATATPILKSLPVPKNTFLLVADEEVRIERMRKRGANENDIANLKINSKLIEGYRKWSALLGHNLHEVDTTNIRELQVAEYIQDTIHSR
ncbi:MAG: hypothetical protein ACHQUA_00190 [Microgenomates group bacterium]